MSIVHTTIYDRQYIGGAETPVTRDKEKNDSSKKTLSSDAPPEETFTPSNEIGRNILHSRFKNKTALMQDIRKAWVTDDEGSPSKQSAKDTQNTKPQPGESEFLQKIGIEKEKGNGVPSRLPESIPVSGAIAQAVGQYNQKEKGASPRVEVGANGALIMVEDEIENEKAPLTDEEKVIAATRIDEKKDSAEVKNLKKSYRDAFTRAGQELKSAQDAAAEGLGTRALPDGSTREVSRGENGNTIVKTTLPDGTVKEVQFNAAYPGNVLIEKTGPGHLDADGKLIPGKTESTYRRGAKVSTGPGEAGTIRGQGDTITYGLTPQGTPQRVEFIKGNSNGTIETIRVEHINEKGELEPRTIPIENKAEDIKRAEESDEMGVIRRRIHQNPRFRDSEGNAIDGRGQVVAFMEGGVDEFSGQLDAHAAWVRDTMASGRRGVAPGAEVKGFGRRMEDPSSLLPGFRNWREAPDKITMEDSRDALIKELDKAMSFDKRIVPALEKILEAQKNGANMSVLNISFGEAPDLYMEQVLHLLEMRNPSNSSDYAYPNLRKQILGDSTVKAPTPEEIARDPEAKKKMAANMKKIGEFVKERMNDPKGGFQQSLKKHQEIIHKLAESGITVVVAANNGQESTPNLPIEGLPTWDSVCSGATLNYFGRSDEAITVAASDSNHTPGNQGDDTIAPFSSHGEGNGGWNPTVAAPGIFLRVEGGVIQGTSFATPHVAGTIALIKQANPHLATGEIRQILIDTATSTGAGQAAQGAGVIDPEKAVEEALRRAGRLPG